MGAGEQGVNSDQTERQGPADQQIDDSTKVVYDHPRMRQVETTLAGFASTSLEMDAVSERLRRLVDAGCFQGALAELDSWPAELRVDPNIIELYETLCREASPPPGYRVFKRIQALDSEGRTYPSFTEMLAHKGLAKLPQALDRLHWAHPGSPLRSADYFSWRAEGDLERAQQLELSFALINFDLDGWRGFADRHGPELTVKATKTVEALLATPARAGLVVGIMGGHMDEMSPRYSMLGVGQTSAAVEVFAGTFLRMLASCSIEVDGERATEPGELTMSCGLAWYERELLDIERIKQAAAHRADLARLEGGNRISSR